MATVTTSARVDPSPADDRPVVFLVSTSTTPRGIREHMGSPAYSYYFVVEALAPVLERVGSWKLIDHPESRLAFAARRAEAGGFRPIHLAVNPLQDVYLSPALPNVIFPFWEFPDVPDRDFLDDTRQNWTRVGRPAALILAACEFTADAFRRAGVFGPVAVVPVPVAPSAFEIPAWDASHSWTVTCRHEVLGPAKAATVEPPGPALPPPPARGLKRRAWLAARSGFRKIAPWLGPDTVGRLTRLRRAVSRRPGELIYVSARDGYRRHVRRWLSDDAIGAITRVKRRALSLAGREPSGVPDPPLPSSALTLSGLVYLTVFNIGDPRKNYRDILTAFLDAFRDRDDVTLVVKLVTNRRCEFHEAGLLRREFEGFGVSHRCRVVVITEFLTEPQMDELFRVSAYYVNASHAEGACLPLLRALAGGRPGIAPSHSAMADYMDETVGFVPRSFPEPTHWPHDPERRLETTRHRLVWSDLRDAFLASADLARHQPHRYHAMSEAARARAFSYAGRTAAERALRDALTMLPPDSPDGPRTFEWPD